MSSSQSPFRWLAVDSWRLAVGTHHRDTERREKGEAVEGELGTCEATGFTHNQKKSGPRRLAASAGEEWLVVLFDDRAPLVFFEHLCSACLAHGAA